MHTADQPAPTPRTDAAEFTLVDYQEEPILVVRAAFARQLERELSAARAEVDSNRLAADNFASALMLARGDAMRYSAECERLRGIGVDSIKKLVSAVERNEAVRKEYGGKFYVPSEHRSDVWDSRISLAAKEAMPDIKALLAALDALAAKRKEGGNG